jgi:hypothetical protein
MADYHEITGLGRTLHPEIPSHRVAFGGAVVAFAVLGVWSFSRSDLTLFGAAAGAVAVFLGWAVARELDPDTTGVAAVALALSFAAAMFVVPSALVTGIALITLRVIAGTVGAALSRFDLPVVVVVGMLCVLDPVSWIMGLALAIGLWSAPEVGSLRRIGLVALAVGIACGIGFGAWQGTLGVGETEVTGTAYALAAAGALAMVFAAQPLPVTSPTDAGGEIVDARRIRLARVAAGSFVMWAAVMGGVDGFWSIGPVFAALVAAAIYRVFIQPANRRA